MHLQAQFFDDIGAEKENVMHSLIHDMNFSESSNTDDLKFINDRTCAMGNICSNRYGIVQVLFYIVQKIKHF